MKVSLRRFFLTANVIKLRENALRALPTYHTYIVENMNIFETNAFDTGGTAQMARHWILNAEYLVKSTVTSMTFMVIDVTLE